MTAPAVILELRVEVGIDEVRRFLGYPSGRPGPVRIEARLAELTAEARSLLRPRGAWVLVGRAQAASAGMPEPAEQVGAAVCTIGAGLEDEVGRRAADGALLDALLLDAFGSAAAEAAADALNREVCDAAAAVGCEALPRESPGYGRWETADQSRLLALLPTAELGVALTAGGMMVPRKSVSFAVGLVAAGEASRHGGDRCARCGLPRCRHRRAPYAG